MNNLRCSYKLNIDLILPKNKKNLERTLYKINKLVEDKENVKMRKCYVGNPLSKETIEIPEIGIYEYFNRSSFTVNDKCININKYSDNKTNSGKHFRKVITTALKNYNDTSINLDDILFYYDERFIKLFSDIFLSEDECNISTLKELKECLKNKYFNSDGKFKYKFQDTELAKHILLNKNDDFVEKYPFDKIDFEMIYRIFVRSFIYMLSSMKSSFNIKISEQTIDMIDKNVEKINNIYNNIEKIDDVDTTNNNFYDLNEHKNILESKQKEFSDFVDLFKSEFSNIESSDSFFKHLVGLSVSDVSKIISFYYKEFVEQFNFKSQKRGEALFNNSLMFSNLYKNPSNIILICMISDYISVSDYEDKILLINTISNYNYEYNMFELKSMIVLSDILSTVMYELNHLDIFPDYIEYEIINSLMKLNLISKRSRIIFNSINDKLNEVYKHINKDKNIVDNLKHVYVKSKNKIES